MYIKSLWQKFGSGRENVTSVDAFHFVCGHTHTYNNEKLQAQRRACMYVETIR